MFVLISLEFYVFVIIFSEISINNALRMSVLAHTAPAVAHAFNFNLRLEQSTTFGFACLFTSKRKFCLKTLLRTQNNSNFYKDLYFHSYYEMIRHCNVNNSKITHK